MTDIKKNEIAESEEKAAKEAAEYTKAFEEACETEVSAPCTGDGTRYTLDYALEQLEKVRNESSLFAVETREKISAIKSGGAGDVGTQAVGEALLALVQEQEQIYRRLTDFYIGMITDLKKDSSRIKSERQQFLDFITACIGASGPGVDLPDFEKIWQMMN